MKKNVIYVDFRFTRKRIVSKKLHLLYKIDYLIKKLKELFVKPSSSKSPAVYPFKKILWI